MSGYENVVAGKLRLKGKALDVRDAGIKKRKKQQRAKCPNHIMLLAMIDSQIAGIYIQNGGEYEQDERLPPAESRYMEWLQKIELERLAKAAKKSHRDRIQDFNQYLANLSEHYDIPKVGPG